MKHRRLYRSIVSAALALFVALPAMGGAIDNEVAAVSREKILAKATLGVQVMRLGAAPADMAEVYSHNSHQPFTPASNLKLVTTAAALHNLGADFKFVTRVYQVGDNLLLVGDGDPSLGDPDFPRRNAGGKPGGVLDAWAKQLKAAGVTRFQHLLVDDSVFDESFFHPDWPADQMDQRYEAQVGGLNLNVNIVDLTVVPTAPGARAEIGSEPTTAYLTMLNGVTSGNENAVNVARQPGTNRVVIKGTVPRGGAKVWATVHDPSLYTGTVLAEAMVNSGVGMSGQVRRERRVAQADVPGGGTTRQAVPPGAKLLLEHETPLASVVARANKDSVNLYAEALCKRMGYDARRGVSGSWENGTAAMGGYLKAIGVPESDFGFADGSGMSKKNAISPRALVRVLCYNFYVPTRDVFVRSLSVAGADGTLEDRFAKSDLQKRVFGKSGFVEGVSTLSGYLVSRDGNWYAFSVMVNGIPRMSNSQVKLLQERIVKAIDSEVGGAAK